MAVIQVDIPIKYLGFFLDDDDELEHIKKVKLPLYISLEFIYALKIYYFGTLKF